MEQPVEELPCRLKKPFQCSAQSDTDIDAVILSQKLQRQDRENEKILKGDRIRQDLVKCCDCNKEVVESLICSCGHKFCGCCVYYDKDPFLPIDCEIPDAEYDEFWKTVREYVESLRCKEERKLDSISSR